MIAPEAKKVLLGYVRNFQILQTAEYVAILLMMRGMRVLPT